MTAVGAKAKAIDALMERASRALEATEYFEAEELCVKAFAMARGEEDFERCGRICLPLQEARRQRRQAACASGRVVMLNKALSGKQRYEVCMYLLEPPLVGIDARGVREAADRQGVATMILVREPTARSGKWPIVGVGTGPREPVVVRVQVDPPAGAPDVVWFQAAQEKLGDAAIAKAPKDVPADHHVDDMVDLLEAVPDHEKLIQALAAACRGAIGATPSKLPRRRPVEANPYSF